MEDSAMRDHHLTRHADRALRSAARRPLAAAV